MSSSFSGTLTFIFVTVLIFLSCHGVDFFRLDVKQPFKNFNFFAWAVFSSHSSAHLTVLNFFVLTLSSHSSTFIFMPGLCLPTFPKTTQPNSLFQFFCAIRLAYKILKNFYCDAIIGLPVVTFSGALRLTSTIAAKVKPFLF